MHEIGRAFGKDHGSIQFLLSQRGGIVPAARRRSLRKPTVTYRLTTPSPLSRGTQAIRPKQHSLLHGTIDCIAETVPKRASGLRQAFTSVQGETVIFVKPRTMPVESFP
jgi:hypothetical protein